MPFAKLRLSRSALHAATAVALLALTCAGYAASASAEGATGSVSGKVVTANRKVVVGAAIKVALNPNANQPAATAAEAGAKKKKAAGLTATTDDNGEFRVDDVPVGQYVVTATEKEIGRARGYVAVKAGKNADLVMQLVPPRKAG